MRDCRVAGPSLDICRADSESEPEGSSIRVEKGVGRGVAEETETLGVD